MPVNYVPMTDGQRCPEPIQVNMYADDDNVAVVNPGEVTAVGP